MNKEDVNLKDFSNEGRKDDGYGFEQFQEMMEMQEKERMEYYESLNLKPEDDGKVFEAIKFYQNDSKKYKNSDGTPKKYWVVYMQDEDGNRRRKYLTSEEKRAWAKAKTRKGIVEYVKATDRYYFMPRESG